MTSGSWASRVLRMLRIFRRSSGATRGQQFPRILCSLGRVSAEIVGKQSPAAVERIIDFRIVCFIFVQSLQRCDPAKKRITEMIVPGSPLRQMRTNVFVNPLRACKSKGLCGHPKPTADDLNLHKHKHSFK